MKASRIKALLWNVGPIPAHRTHTKPRKSTQELEHLMSRSCCWGGEGSSRIRMQPPLQRAPQTKSRNKQTNREGLAMSFRNENEVKGGRSAKTQRAGGSQPAFPPTALPAPNCSCRALRKLHSSNSNPGLASSNDSLVPVKSDEKSA